MRNAEILKGGQSADRRRNQIIGDEQKRTDDRNALAAMSHARVHAATVGVKTADDHVINADECGQYTHQGDEPKRGVTCDGEGKTDDVSLARAPVTVEDRSRAFPIDIARTLNVGRYQLLQLKTKRQSRDEALHRRFPSTPFCPLMMLTRLAVGLEPLNALDAAHRSPRSVVGSPVKPATRRVIKRNKELVEISKRKIEASN